jgi:uncharacterized membrane protein
MSLALVGSPEFRRQQDDERRAALTRHLEWRIQEADRAFWFGMVVAFVIGMLAGTVTGVGIVAMAVTR